MTRLMFLDAPVAAAFLTAALWTPVHANTSPPPSVKRQMIECMTQRMSASRAISYNDAARECRDTLRAQIAALASNTTKPGTAH